MLSLNATMPCLNATMPSLNATMPSVTILQNEESNASWNVEGLASGCIRDNRKIDIQWDTHTLSENSDNL
jgi:hypothetical protein